MKTIFKHYDLQTQGKVLQVSLTAMLRAVGIEGGEVVGPIPADVVDSLCIGVQRPGVSGVVPIVKDAVGHSHYEVEGDLVTITIGKLPSGINTMVMSASYGTNLPMQLMADLQVPQNAPDGYDEAESVDFAVVKNIGGGGGYKTDVYMDGDGRVIVERGEDGSTMILDEHENPILKRNADGSTQYFDAYQSARLMFDAHGNVSLNYTEDETVKTLQLAEAILARTSKHLLYNTAGETTIKDEEGNVLTHAQIYAMLMSTPDFVVLVRSDHAFHPNLVTPTQIAFTCTYYGTDGMISTERVNITDANVVTYTSGKGIAAASNGSVNIGQQTIASGSYSMAQGGSELGGQMRKCQATGARSHAEGYCCEATNANAHAEGNFSKANGESSHAEGSECTANGARSHAEGRLAIAFGENSHAEGDQTRTYGGYAHAEGYKSYANGNASHSEGTRSEANGGTSHAEGNYCETGTNGGSAHAEGSYTNANGAASHAEGYRTVTTEGGQHAQGCWNKSEGGQYSFMHGCGTDADNRANAFLIAGAEVYMYGIGGYDGTNYGTEGVQSVQEVIRSLLNA